MGETIPDLYHFIWMGRPKPFFLIVAIQSVLVRCREARVILWTDSSGEEDVAVTELLKNPRFEMKAIHFEQLLSQLGMEKLESLFTETFHQAGAKNGNSQTRPIERSKSNLLRYLILYLHGGIYLDADTILLKNLKPIITDHSGFLGKENTVWPITKRKNPLHRFIWAPFLEVVRFLIIQMPFGYRLNGAFRKLCSSAENNAVLGFSQRHNYLNAVLSTIASMPQREVVRPLRLGPYLLQKVSKAYKAENVKTFDETYFYPFGPLISQHFFKRRKDGGAVASEMIPANCYVVHWGASTKFLNGYNQEFVQEHPNRSVFNFLTSQVIAEYQHEQV